MLILVNLVISFGDPGSASAAHLGGLVAGVLCALAILAGERGDARAASRLYAELALMTVIASLSIVGAIAVA